MIKRNVIQVDYGIASAYSDGSIEINKKLKGNLRKKILKHELSHSVGKYTKKDYDVDFKSKKPHFFEVLKFSIKRPQMLIGYFLFMYSYNKRIMTFNTTALFPLVYLGLIWTIFFGLLFRINLFIAFIGWICYYLTINLFLLFYTHFYVYFKKSNL